MPTHLVRPRTPKTPKSTKAARRLIRAAEVVMGSQREAAKLLSLPNQAQLRKMKLGLLADTPAMKAALARQQERRERARGRVKDPERNLDTLAMRRMLRSFAAQIEVALKLVE